jgi:hypothetical protein
VDPDPAAELVRATHRTEGAVEGAIAALALLHLTYLVTHLAGW